MIRKELEDLELDDDHRARIEDFLFKKSLFLEVRNAAFAGNPSRNKLSPNATFRKH